MSAKLEVEIGASLSGLQKGLLAAQNQVKGFAGKVDGLTDGISKSFTGIGGAISGIVSTGAMIAFGKQVLQTTAEFQKFGAVLSNTLGSEALSNLKLKEIQDFAAKTPNGVAELTSSFVKLANQGFKPTGDQMRKLGDLAASTGKSFDQLAEAIIDGQVGEYERLKEFGIRAKDAGDKVIFTFKGVQTTVDKTSESIRNYITSLGDAEGVSGSMAKISETLTGKISNLGDKWDQMLVSIGGNTTGVFSMAMDEIGDAIDKVTQYNKQLELASKYNLSGSNFGQELNRALNPFASKGATDIERQVAGITIAQEETTKFVSSAIEGAKTTADFGKAIAKLSQMGKDYANLHLGEKGFSKAEQRGIIDQYQQGIKALQDARSKFIENLNKGPEANFGTTSTKKTPEDVLKQLGFDLNTIKQTAGISGQTFAESFKERVGAYTKAIGGLIDLGVSGNSPVIQNLKSQAQTIADNIEPIKVQFKSAADVVKTSFNTLNGLSTAGLMQAALAVSTAGALMVGSLNKVNATNLLPFAKSLELANLNISTGANGVLNTLVNLSSDVNNLITGSLAGAFQEIGTSIGEALATGGNVIQAVGNTVLNAFGSFLGELGRMLVSYGTAALIKAKLDAGMMVPGAGFVLGPAAIAAGAAMMAISGAIGALAKSGGSRGSGSYGSGGGMPMPNTNYARPANTGNYSYSNSGGGTQMVYAVLRGTDIVLSYDRTKANLAGFKV